MKNIKYPPKPWKDGQTAELLKGMKFAYSSSMNKWVPLSPGYSNEVQLEEAFGVTTVAELNDKFVNIDQTTAVLETKSAQLETKALQLETKTEALDSDIKLSGRIWKSTSKPTSPSNNDVWMENATGRIFNYDALYDTWVEN